MFDKFITLFRARSLFIQIVSILFVIIIITLLIMNRIHNQHTQKLIDATSYETALSAVKSVVPLIENDLASTLTLRKTLRTLQRSNPNFLYFLLSRKDEYYLHVSVHQGTFENPSHTITLTLPNKPDFTLKVIYSNQLFFKQIQKYSFFDWWLLILISGAMLCIVGAILFILKPLRTHAKRIYELTKPIDRTLHFEENEDSTIYEAFNVIMQSNRVNESKLKMLNVHLEDLIDSKTAFLKEEIKERQVAENQLEHSIGEKTILLKEVHHRVKNNLAVITGLIRMQSRRIDDASIKSMFTDLQNRVKTMELIHTNLYASKDFNRIDMSTYLDSLAQNLGRSFSKTQGDVTFEIDCDALFLSIDQAITCGQIVNELVTNAFKHAFKDQSHGKISITMEVDEDLCTLIVKDNGKGSKKADPEKFSLGLSLVHELTRYQLKGKVKISEGNGLKYQISFKKS